jgi:hypothetical protein
MTMNAISTSSRSGIITFHRPLEAKGLLLVLLLVLALPAMADGQGGRTQVSGDSVFSDCGDFAIEMTGDLNGCLEIFPERYSCEEGFGVALYREWGEVALRADEGSGRGRGV